MQHLLFLYSHQGPENPKAEPDTENTVPIINFAQPIEKQLGNMTRCLKCYFGLLNNIPIPICPLYFPCYFLCSQYSANF